MTHLAYNPLSGVFDITGGPQSQSYKDPALVATTANLTATYSNGTAGVGATLTNSGSLASLTIDGVGLSTGNRVLVKNQTTTYQNGIYTVTNAGSGSVDWILTRATDYNVPADINQGAIIGVTSGTVNGETLWVETSSVTTIGTDPITFSIVTSGIVTTQHASLVGGASNSIVNVGPGAEGTVFVGTGATSDPEFSDSPTVTKITITDAPVDGTDGVNKTYADSPRSLVFTTPGSYPYTAANTDGVVFVDSSVARTINLPTSPATFPIYIKDGTGNAGINTITISGNGNTIDGASSYLINNSYGAIKVAYNGSSWSIL